MWSVLKQSHLEQAKVALERRRSEMLQRHAEEIVELEAEQADVVALRRLAAAFCDKFNVTAAAPRAEIAASPARPAPAKPPREAWRVAPRGQHQSNFAMFSGAVARAF
jgi:hypothetical protein